MGRPSKRAAADIPPWARRITAAREQAGFSQKRLSEFVPRSNRAISDWENGKSEPNIAQFHAIAEATGVDVAWLILGGEPDSGNAFPGILADAEKAHRHFAWVLYEASRLLTEEGVKADVNELFVYVEQLLAAAQDCPDDNSAKEAIARKLESDRAELRLGLEKVKGNLINPINPQTSR